MLETQGRGVKFTRSKPDGERYANADEFGSVAAFPRCTLSSRPGRGSRVGNNTGESFGGIARIQSGSVEFPLWKKQNAKALILSFSERIAR